MSAPEFGGEIVWPPTPELIAQSHLTLFMDRHGIGSLDELMRRSTADVAWFWDAVLKLCRKLCRRTLSKQAIFNGTSTKCFDKDRRQSHDRVVRVLEALAADEDVALGLLEGEL